jgi:hypothetical protein
MKKMRGYIQGLSKKWMGTLQDRRELYSPLDRPEIIRIFMLENENVWEFPSKTIIVLKSLSLLEVRKRRL